MGAIIPVISGGGGGGYAAYPRRQVDNSGAAFLAALMSGDRYQSRSDPNATLALVLQLAMQKESLAENRRQFEAMLAERSGQFEDQQKTNQVMREQIQANIENSRRQHDLLEKQYTEQRSDVEEVRERLLDEQARGRTSEIFNRELERRLGRIEGQANIEERREAMKEAKAVSSIPSAVPRSLAQVYSTSGWMDELFGADPTAATNRYIGQTNAMFKPGQSASEQAAIASAIIPELEAAIVDLQGKGFGSDRPGVIESMMFGQPVGMAKSSQRMAQMQSLNRLSTHLDNLRKLESARPEAALEREIGAAQKREAVFNSADLFQRALMEKDPLLKGSPFSFSEFEEYLGDPNAAVTTSRPAP